MVLFFPFYSAKPKSICSLSFLLSFLPNFAILLSIGCRVSFFRIGWRWPAASNPTVEQKKTENERKLDDCKENLRSSIVMLRRSNVSIEFVSIVSSKGSRAANSSRTSWPASSTAKPTPRTASSRSSRASTTATRTASSTEILRSVASLSPPLPTRCGPIRTLHRRPTGWTPSPVTFRKRRWSTLLQWKKNWWLGSDEGVDKSRTNQSAWMASYNGD